MSDQISLKDVSKLDGSNYQLWKFHMRAIFNAYGLLDIVNGGVLEPPATDSGHSSWVKRNGKAMHIISSSLEPSQLELLITCESAADMWSKLVSIHEQKSATNKLLLMTKFHDYRMSSSDTVTQHIAKIENMARQLRDVGERVSDITIMAKIIGSLPSKYSAFITAWDSVDPDRQTQAYLTERLIKEEARMTTNDEAASALAATSARERNTSQEEQREKTQQQGGSSQQQRRSVECFYCHNKGHIARSCRKRQRDINQNKSKTKNNNHAKPGNSNLGAFSATSADHGVEFLNYDPRDVWLLDSGASKHMTNRREWFSELRQSRGESIKLGDDATCQVEGTGTILIQRYVDGKWESGRLEDVLYIPTLRKNLFSVGVCTQKNHSVTFKDDCVQIFEDNVLKASGIRQSNQLYRMLFKVVTGYEANVASCDTLKRWHERLGHVNVGYLRKMVSKDLVNGVKFLDNEDFFCEGCQHGKQHRLPFRPNPRLKTEPGEFIHTDMCGPMPQPSLGGNRFFVLFKDDATGFRYIYFVQHRGDVFERFKAFERLVENKFQRPVRMIRSDCGTEYTNGDMQQYLASKGIQFEASAPYTPEQNGRSEREMRTVVESARSMIYSKKIPIPLWAEAVNTAVYTYIEPSPSVQAGDSTPYELWTGKKPSLSHVKVFGCDAFVHVPKQKRKKWDSKSKKVMLVGYQGESANYRLFDPATNKVTVSRDVSFNENENVEPHDPSNGISFPLDMEVIDLPADEPPPNQDEDARDPEEEEDIVEVAEESPPRPPAAEPVGITRLPGKRVIRQPIRYEANVADLDEPVTYEEAVTCDQAKFWKQAIDEELHSHTKNSTWSLVPLPKGRRVIGCKWVFKLKQSPDGEVQRYKARLCAKGFSQKAGIDYEEVFSPVVRYESIRVLLALAAHEDLEIEQFDIKTAFLYGDLDDEIYMSVPEGIEVQGNNIVCRLHKSLYGLKQASRCWNRKFDSFLKQFDFMQSDADKCVYTGFINNDFVRLALYVDDGLIMAKSRRALDMVITVLKESFEVTIGDTSCFVGMQIDRNRDEKAIFVHQTAYIRRMLSRFNMSDAKGNSVPADPHTVLQSPDEPSREYAEKIPYREAVGSLLFLAMVSRPDIEYAVNVVSRYSSNYDNSHWQAVKRIFRYLKETCSWGILYSGGGSEAVLMGYLDSDFAGDVDTRRSTTGYVFELSNGPVTWCSKRQESVSLSTTEAEYIAASTATQEAVWLRNLLHDLGHTCRSATKMHVDNTSAIKLTKNSEFHKRTKHIDVRYHFIREQYSKSVIEVLHVPTERQHADVFTKVLSRNTFKNLCELMGIVPSI